MVEIKTINDRKQFHVDLGDMQPEQAQKYLDEIKEQFGKTKIDFSETKEK